MSTKQGSANGRAWLTKASLNCRYFKHLKTKNQIKMFKCNIRSYFDRELLFFRIFLNIINPYLLEQLMINICRDYLLLKVKTNYPFMKIKT